MVRFGLVLLAAAGTAAALPADDTLLPDCVTAHPIVFVVRHQYAPDHHNTETMFQTGEINAEKFQGGGAIRTLDLANGGRLQTLLEVPAGVARDLDVHFSGERIVFSMRRDAQDDYHIYDMAADGTELRQLTFGAGVSDIDPIYLPDGRILFSSTREPKYCMCNRHIMCNLFTMEADGANIQQIGHSTLFEGHASLLADGRVLYDRWEYVDRNFGDAQGVWVCHPDGANHALYWGNNTNSPGAVLDNRAIPGTDLFIGVFAACHDRPWGALAIVDRQRGLDGRVPVVRTWPAAAIDLVGQGNYDTFLSVQPKYEDPYPVSDRVFLCARMVGNGEQMGLYAVELDGGEHLLHAELPGCYDPMPLAARPCPPVLAPRTDLTQAYGVCYVADVYAGSGMERVPRGTVKRLRVVESPEKRFWTTPAWDGGTGQQAPAMAWDDFNNKRVLGTAPVEADGSAYFQVPADRFVYFQLLDEHGMMVQSMRSGTIVRPGERVGCVGCHEQRLTSVPVQSVGLAMRRAASVLEPWYGPEREFGYLAEVQPVLDRHCVGCHDYGQEAGQKLNLAGDLGLPFNTSYVQLRKKQLVRVPGAGPAETLPPMSWGSHASPLVEILRQGHGDPAIDQQVQLDAESFDRVVTWIDLNAPYYPVYASAYRDNRFGRSPLDDAQLAEIRRLTGSEDVNLTRPQWSPCLARFEDPADPARLAALAIIEAGQRQLAIRPRGDMPDFQLVAELEQRQQAKYDRLQHAEAQGRAAAVRGDKFYARE
ncbi:MAG: hypothetical protein MUF48_04480 [Pirellulaceae bacterium]|nr:hypothetical protein [Pirellulaceae bacterium]